MRPPCHSTPASAKSVPFAQPSASYHGLMLAHRADADDYVNGRVGVGLKDDSGLDESGKCLHDATLRIGLSRWLVCG
jgi:hypothetical protein